MSLQDKAYLELCSIFEEKSKHAKLCFNTDDDEDNNDADFLIPQNFHYTWTVGTRSDSELMYAVEDEILYVSNGKIVTKDGDEAFTCYEKKCKGRIYLKQNGIAYKVKEHTVNHGSMYNKYIEMQCREMMREQCRISGASKSISDIYEEAVIL